MNKQHDLETMGWSSFSAVTDCLQNLWALRSLKTVLFFKFVSIIFKFIWCYSIVRFCEGRAL